MRARTLKPDFFKNEALAELGDASMLLFAGLWCLADRMGRLEDRPKRIGAEVFPYRSRNVSRMLDRLDSAGLIHRYAVAGKAYIQVVNFLKHQHPHPRELDSEIPSPDNTIIEKQDLGDAQAIPRHGRAGQDLQDLQDLPTTLPPGSSGPSHSSRAGAREDQPTGGASPAQPETEPDEHQARTSLNPDALAIVWNELVRPPIPKCRSVTPERREKARALLGHHPDIEFWRSVIRRILASPHCRGENSSGWFATYDWLLKPDTHVKVLEGNYDAAPARSSPDKRTAGNVDAARRFVHAGGKP